MHNISDIFINIENLREKLYKRQTFKAIAIEAFQVKMELQAAMNNFDILKQFATRFQNKHDYDKIRIKSIQPIKIEEIFVD